MAKFDVFNVLGKTVSTVELSDEVFGIEPHNQSMFDLVIFERALFRQGTHSTKNRAEVRGGGRKPWKQKGTGRARQGSIRSPQWRGGGIVFGPTPERNYALKINKKVKKLALKSGWSQLVRQNKVLILDNIDFKSPSTKDFSIMLSNFQAADKKIMLVIDHAKAEYHNTYLSARNLDNVFISYTNEIYLNDLLNADFVLMTNDIAKTIEGSYQ